MFDWGNNGGKFLFEVEYLHPSPDLHTRSHGRSFFICRVSWKIHSPTIWTQKTRKFVADLPANLRINKYTISKRIKSISWQVSSVPLKILTILHQPVVGFRLSGKLSSDRGLFAKIPHAMDAATQSDRLSTSVNKQPMERSGGIQPWMNLKKKYFSRKIATIEKKRMVNNQPILLIGKSNHGKKWTNWNISPLKSSEYWTKWVIWRSFPCNCLPDAPLESRLLVWNKVATAVEWRIWQDRCEAAHIFSFLAIFHFLPGKGIRKSENGPVERLCAATGVLWTQFISTFGSEVACEDSQANVGAKSRTVWRSLITWGITFLFFEIWETHQKALSAFLFYVLDQCFISIPRTQVLLWRHQQWDVQFYFDHREYLGSPAELGAHRAIHPIIFKSP